MNYSFMEWLEFDKIELPPSMENLVINPVSGQCRKEKISAGEPKCNKKCLREDLSKTVDSIDSQFACRHCGKRYRWKSTMRRHEQVECGGKEPTFKCPLCPYSAKQKGNLGVHIRKHHQNPSHCSEYFDKPSYTTFINNNNTNAKNNNNLKCLPKDCGERRRRDDCGAAN